MAPQSSTKTPRVLTEALPRGDSERSTERQEQPDSHAPNIGSGGERQGVPNAGRQEAARPPDTPPESDQEADDHAQSASDTGRSTTGSPYFPFRGNPRDATPSYTALVTRNLVLPDDDDDSAWDNMDEATRAWVAAKARSDAARSLDVQWDHTKWLLGQVATRLDAISLGAEQSEEFNRTSFETKQTTATTSR